MSSPKIIEELWHAYLAMCVPAGASQIQLRQTKVAFYYGAQALLQAIVRDLDPEEEPSDSDLARLDAISRELEDFAEALVEGHCP